MNWNLIVSYLEELALKENISIERGYTDYVSDIYKRDGDSEELSWVSQYSWNHPSPTDLCKQASFIKSQNL